MATQTESPRAAPTKTVEVQVNLEKKVSVATQTVQLDNGWVSGPEIEQPMNEQPSVSNILVRLCILSNAYSKPKSPPPHEAQVAEPPVPFETLNKKKRRGKKQKDKDANFGYM